MTNDNKSPTTGKLKLFARHYEHKLDTPIAEDVTESPSLSPAANPWGPSALYTLPHETLRVQEKQTVENSMVSLPATTRHPSTAKVQPTDNYCETCNQTFPTAQLKAHKCPPWHCTVCSLTLHLGSKDKHNRSYQHNSLLIDAQLEAARLRAGSFHCATCNDNFGLAVQSFHRSRDRDCKICGIKTHADWMGAHLASAEHAANVARAEGPQMFYCETCKKAFKEQHTSPAWECKLCQEVMHITSAQSHRTSTNHMEKLKRYWESSMNVDTVAPEPLVSVSQTPGMFYYELCEQEYTNSMVEVHSSPSWVCTVCRRFMHSAWKGSHLGSVKHAKKVREGGPSTA